MEIEDGITQKDLDIAISVSVVVTAVVIVTLVFIIYVCRKKRMCEYIHFLLSSQFDGRYLYFHCKPLAES